MATQPANEEDDDSYVHVPTMKGEEDKLARLENELVALRKELQQVSEERDHWEEVATNIIIKHHNYIAKVEEVSGSSDEVTAAKNVSNMNTDEAPWTAEGLRNADDIPLYIIPMTPLDTKLCREDDSECGEPALSGYDEMESCFCANCWACIVWTRGSSPERCFEGEVIWNSFKYSDFGEDRRTACVEDCQKYLCEKMKHEGDCVDAYMHQTDGTRVRWTLTRDGGFTTQIFEQA